MRLNKKNIWLSAPLALAFSASIPDEAQAQRQAPSREDRREQRNERLENMSPEERETARRQRQQERERNMSPEQRERMRQWREERARREAAGEAQGGGDWGRGGGGGGDRGGWRNQQEEVDVMAEAGITDENVKDAIRAFVVAQQEARQPLLKMAREITLDLGKPETTPAKMTTRLTEFRAALAVDQKRYETALAELDTRIGYTKNPRLETFLTMAGVLGYEAPQVGGSIAIFANLKPRTQAPAPAPMAGTGAAPPKAAAPGEQ